MPRIEPERQRAAHPPEARHQTQRQRLNDRDQRRARNSKSACPFQRKQILRTQSWKSFAPLTIWISTRMK